MSARIVTPPDDPDRGITLQEAASRLGVQPPTVRKLIERGYLDAWRIHSGPRKSRIRVALSSVLDYRERYAIHRTTPSRLAARLRPKPVPASAAHNNAVRGIYSFLNGGGKR